MKILCHLVGHQPPVYSTPGWYSPGNEYGWLVPGAVDGIGRQHALVKAKCARCGKDFTVARVHLLKPEEL
jgi:hypothetical protein